MGRRIIVLVCSAAALTAFIFYFFLRAPEQPATSNLETNSSSTNVSGEVLGKSQLSQATVNTSSSETPAKSRLQAPVRYFETSLPQDGLPLSSTLEALKGAADQGNYWAACRLAADVYECSTHNFLKSQLDFVKSVLVDTGTPPESLGEVRREIKLLEKELPKSAALCEGYSPTDVEPWKYLLQAALAGHVPSKAAFVLKPPVNITNLFSNVEFADAYKGNAPVLLLEAAAAGNLDAVEGAAWGYLGANGSSVFKPGFGMKLLPTDFFRAAVYYYASSGLDVTEPSHFNRREDLRKRIEETTTIDQRIRAKADADSMTASWTLSKLEPRSDSQGQQKKRNGNYRYMCTDSERP